MAILSAQQVYNLALTTATYLVQNVAIASDINVLDFTDTATGIAFVESKFNPLAKNKKSTAKGLMQMLDTTKNWVENKFLGTKPSPTARMYEPTYNLRVCMTYLAYLYKKYDNDWGKAVWAFNQGNYNSTSKAGKTYYTLWLNALDKVGISDLRENASIYDNLGNVIEIRFSPAFT